MAGPPLSIMPRLQLPTRKDDLIACARRPQAGHAARQIGCKIAGFVGSACVIEQQREHAKTLRGTPEKGELRRASTELRC
jgi:hypothetical protein